MLDSRAGRLAAVAALVVALLALAVRYGAAVADPAPGLAFYPGEDHLAADYGAFVGQRVQVSGIVVGVDPVVIAAEYETWTGGRYRTGTIRLTITEYAGSVAPGDRLQVFGTARPERTVRAERTVAVPGANYRYMYGVSFLAGLWVLARLARGWTVSRGDLAARPRADPPTAGDVLARLREPARPGDPGDAEEGDRGA
jgi:hypothetical protein